MNSYVMKTTLFLAQMILIFILINPSHMELLRGGISWVPAFFLS